MGPIHPAVAILVAVTMAGAAEIPVVDDRAPFSATVAVVNAWDAAVRPLAVESTCTCLTGSIAPDPIPPGGVAALRVQLATAGRSGLQEAVITVVTDRPGRVLTATAAWIVDPRVHLDEVPAGHDPAAGRPPPAWRQIRRVMVPRLGDRPGERRLRIAGRDPAFAVTGVRIDGRAWTATGEPIAAGVWLVTIRADLERIAADDLAETELHIATTDPERPTLLVPVELARGAAGP
jgi:hypothetical protein